MNFSNGVTLDSSLRCQVTVQIRISEVGRIILNPPSECTLQRRVLPNNAHYTRPCRMGSKLTRRVYCCEMQWSVPKPQTKSRQSMGMTSRPGKQPASTSAAAASRRGWRNAGMICAVDHQEIRIARRQRVPIAKARLRHGQFDEREFFPGGRAHRSQPLQVCLENLVILPVPA